MFGEGFPFDLVLFTLIVFTLIGVNASKVERKAKAEEREKLSQEK